MAIMDINPICDGHVLVIPKNHYETFLDVPNDVLSKMNNVARMLTPILMEKASQKGLTYSINYGDKQEVKHLHMHLMPNFHAPATIDVSKMHKMIMDGINEKKKIEEES